MARRVTRPTTPTASSSKQQPTNIDKPSIKDYVLSTRDMVMSNRFQLAMGIILIAITLMLLIAFVSFFFTGANDFSILEHTADRRTMRSEIQNALGLPGAVISRWLVDGTFGIVSLAALVALALTAVRMVAKFTLNHLRLLFITLFILLWGSIALGFAQQMIGIGTFFRWGGAFGQIVAEWAISYIQWIGVLLILIAILIVFLIVVDKHFVEHCQQLGLWIKNLFAKPTKTATTEELDTESITNEEDTPDNIIDIILDELPAVEEEKENVTLSD